MSALGSHRKSAFLIAALIPIAVAVAVRFLATASPAANAGANEVTPDPASVSPFIEQPIEIPSADTTSTDAMRAALSHARHLRTLTLSRNPMAFPAVPVVRERTPVSSRPKPVREVPPSIDLSAILKSSNALLVIIDGQTRQLGDTVADGWKLTAIDPAQQSVTLTSPRGRSVEFKVSGGR